MKSQVLWPRRMSDGSQPHGSVGLSRLQSGLMYLARSVLDHDEAIFADGSSLLRIGGRGSCISAVKMDIMMLFSHFAEIGRHSNLLSPGVMLLRSPRRPFSPQHESSMGNEGGQVGSVLLWLGD